MGMNIRKINTPYGMMAHYFLQRDYKHASINHDFSNFTQTFHFTHSVRRCQYILVACNESIWKCLTLQFFNNPLICQYCISHLMAATYNVWFLCSNHYVWLILVLFFNKFDKKNIWLLHTGQRHGPQNKLLNGCPRRGIWRKVNLQTMASQISRPASIFVQTSQSLKINNLPIFHDKNSTLSRNISSTSPA